MMAKRPLFTVKVDEKRLNYVILISDTVLPNMHVLYVCLFFFEMLEQLQLHINLKSKHAKFIGIVCITFVVRGFQ